MDEDMEFTCDLSAFGAESIIEQTYLTNDDMKAINTADAPTNVIPENGGDAAIVNGKLTATLGKHSFNMIRVKLA